MIRAGFLQPLLDVGIERPAIADQDRDRHRARLRIADRDVPRQRAAHAMRESPTPTRRTIGRGSTTCTSAALLTVPTSAMPRRASISSWSGTP